jgi:hypothetical protein
VAPDKGCVGTPRLALTDFDVPGRLGIGYSEAREEGTDLSRAQLAQNVAGVPIACTLRPSTVGARLDARRRLLGQSVAQVHRDSPQRLRLTLREGAGVAEVVELARQRTKSGGSGAAGGGLDREETSRLRDE